MSVQEVAMKNMLKMLGVDANAIVEQIGNFARFAQEAAETLGRVERKIDALALQQDRIETALRRSEARAPAILNG